MALESLLNIEKGKYKGKQLLSQIIFATYVLLVTLKDGQVNALPY